MVGRVTDCTLDDIDRLYFIDDQNGLYPENYVSYTRTRTSEFDCFLEDEGGCEEITGTPTWSGDKRHRHRRDP